MQNTHAGMIWRGRLHLGDEPGIYGDAAYAGLAVDLPFTLIKYEDEGTPDDITLLLGAEGVTVFPTYEGHAVTIMGYRDVSQTNSIPRWEEAAIANGRLTEATLSLRLDARKTNGLRHFSLRVRVDTEVAAGNYDDFVLVSLSLRSDTHYPTFGFH